MRFAENFELTIWTYKPRFSDPYQLIQLLVSESKARECIEKAGWKLPSMEFWLHSPEACTEWINLEITQTYPRAFSKNHKVDKGSTMLVKIEWINPDYYGRLGKKLLSNIWNWHLNHSLTTKMILCLTVPFKRRRQWHPTPVLLPGKSHGGGAW